MYPRLKTIEINGLIIDGSCRHAWMSYMVDAPPTVDKLMQPQLRAWEPKEHRPVLTASRSAYKPYNTYASQCDWRDAARERCTDCEQDKE